MKKTQEERGKIIFKNKTKKKKRIRKTKFTERKGYMRNK